MTNRPAEIPAVRASLERAALARFAGNAPSPAGSDARDSIMQLAAREASRAESVPHRASPHPRSPALWAAIGALAGAEVAWIFPRTFGLGG